MSEAYDPKAVTTGTNGQQVNILVIDGKPQEIDVEITDVVSCLVAGRVPTLASCSGHGFRPGHIILRDGRHIFIADDEQARQINELFPLDINGMRVEDER